MNRSFRIFGALGGIFAYILRLGVMERYWVYEVFASALMKGLLPLESRFYVQKAHLMTNQQLRRALKALLENSVTEALSMLFNSPAHFQEEKKLRSFLKKLLKSSQEFHEY